MEHAKAGFVYTVETIRNGEVVDTEVIHNLIPTEGINYLIGAGLKGATPVTSWYVGLFEGDYSPVAGDTMATFPGNATECTAYVETARPALTLGTVSGGTVDNTASKAEFTGNATGKLVKGGFISSVPTKGATTGVLVSAVRFTTPKSLDAGSTLRVTAGFSIFSA